ncbi:hypothetical protein CWB73_18680 [Pseudoalteromonas phenolica]|uniref:Beta-lactamase-related domain-containing protein n=2 Tax=Pseudoalteromonas phenolica TaxID=161398 RepID=A0A5S3YQ33_9GAMM|nr:hypothetical protein CWB73_18680 [Pseudoalteromonas phenolica]
MNIKKKLNLRIMIKRLTFLIGIPFVLIFSFLFYTDLHLYMRPTPKSFDEMLSQYMEAAKLPGASVLVFKEGEIVFSKQYGRANLESQTAPTQTTLYQVASVSKLVTGTAVIKLYEQGKLKLDDDINQYLPFSVRNPHFPDTPITIRMLLSHVSSISDGSFFLGSPYWDLYQDIGKKTFKPEALAQFIEGYFTSRSEYYDQGNNFNTSKPGTQPEYSNVAYGLLGYLVEHVSGMPFYEFCKQEIFTPLEMQHTRWLSENLETNDVAVPYSYHLMTRDYQGIGTYEMPTYADGGLKTSAIEFMRFLHIFVNDGNTIQGAPFLQPEAVDEMLTVQYPKVNKISGLTWWVDDNKYMHGGSDPGVKALVAISKHEQWGFIFFANGGGFRTELGFELFRDDLYDYLNRYGPPLNN